MVSILNGLSSLGSGVAGYAANAGAEAQKGDVAQQLQQSAGVIQGGLQQQRAQLEQQQAVLADQLATTRESAGRVQTGQIAATAAQALAGTGTAGRTQAGGIAAAAAEKQQAFELQKAQLAASLPTPEEREVRAYTGGAAPGSPEYQKGVQALALLKAGISPDLYGSNPSSPSPAPAPTTPVSGSAATATPPSSSSAAAATGAPALPASVAAVVNSTPGAPATPAAATSPGVGLSYKPLEPGLDNGPPSGGYNESVLAGKPAWLVAKVHAINEGREEPPNPRSLSEPKSPEFVANALLNQYNPNFDATLYPTRQKTRNDVANGPLGTGITAANTVLQHANEFAENAVALNNGQIPAFNWIANKTLEAAGSPRPLVLQATVDALASEARKVYAGAGGGTQADLDAWQQNFPINGSPSQQQGAMGELSKLLTGRLTAVANQINGGMQTNLSGTDLLNPAAKASYEKLIGPNPPPTSEASGPGGSALVGTALAGPVGGAATAAATAAREIMRAARPGGATAAAPPPSTPTYPALPPGFKVLQ